MKILFSRIGCYFALFYLALGVVIYIYTAANTRPENVGLDWIFFILLAMPWYGISTALLIPGLFINAALLYCLGAMIEAVFGDDDEGNDAMNNGRLNNP